MEGNGRGTVRFEVSTAVTMKNGVFWDIETHFVLHRRHMTSPLHSPVSECNIRKKTLRTSQETHDFSTTEPPPANSI
jgi:hypothetical protein